MDAGRNLERSAQQEIAVRRDPEAIDDLLLASAALLEGLPDAVVASGSDGDILFMNGLAEELFGYTREELLGKPVETLWPERLRERYTRNMRLYFATKHPLRFSTEVWGARRDGSEFIGEMSWGIVASSTGPLLLAIGRDISERRANEARLRAIAAMSERALVGASLAELARDVVELIRSSVPIAGVEVRLADGTVLASSGSITNVGVKLPLGAHDELLLEPERDITDDEISFVRTVANTLGMALARLREEERIRHDAVHDPLTGLANRILLRDRLEHAVALSERQGSATGLLFIDLDNFKEVNDEYGHAAGDAVLVELGERMRMVVRPSDTMARLGGDEFVAVCENVNEESVLALGRRLQESIRLPMTISGVEHNLSACIGIALGQANPDELLGNADTAVYRAKASGPGRIELFN
jgi:diguanylate cyclase (GGDEF)-like protein/PAS domain S-box-containing protein